MYRECIYCGRLGIPPPFHVKTLGNTEINFDLHAVTVNCSGTRIEINFKRKEYLVFEFLARHLGQLVQRVRLKEYIKVKKLTTLCTHVSVVRMKLNVAGSSCWIWHSKDSQKQLGGLGYMMEVQDE